VIVVDRTRILCWGVLKACLLVAGLVFTNHHVISRLLYFWEWQLFIPLAVFLAIWLFAVLAVIYLAFTPVIAARAVWTPVVAVSSFAGDVFFRITGDRLSLGNIEAMEVGYMSVDEIIGIASFYLHYGTVSLACTALLCVGILLPLPQIHWRLLASRWLVALPFIPYALLTALVVHIAGNRTAEDLGMPQQYYPVSVLTVWLLSRNADPSKADVDIPRSKKAASLHIVLVVDESVRGDFVDLSGVAGTTPFLASRADGIIDFGLSVSGNNCSNGSNAILRYGANPALIGNRNEKLLSHPSIWKYADAAGFDTTFMDGQGIAENSYGYMNAEELALIDTVISVPPEIDTQRSDFYLAEKLGTVLESNRPQFVLVNKRGVHFSYHSNYPEEAEVFKPSLKGARNADDRVSLLNSYRNAVKWNVDGFFEHLLTSKGLDNTVLIYTSDHGQNLMDDPTPVTHCRRLSPILEEALVPLLVITQIPALHDAFQEAAARNLNRTSGFQVFPTILELMGYNPQHIYSKYYQSLFVYQAAPLGFTSGPIAGPHAQKPNWNWQGDARLPRAGIGK